MLAIRAFDHNAACRTRTICGHFCLIAQSADDIGQAATPNGSQNGSRSCWISFNIYEHLEAAINEAHAGFAREGSPPLRLVVLDTAVGLGVMQ
jgi:hypothetical protein